MESQAPIEGGPSDVTQVRELNKKTKEQAARKKGENGACLRDSGPVKGPPQRRGRTSNPGTLADLKKARALPGAVRRPRQAQLNTVRHQATWGPREQVGKGVTITEMRQERGRTAH